MTKASKQNAKPLAPIVLRDAETDAIAALHYGLAWRSVDSMPRDVFVTVLTVRGLTRQARLPQGPRWIKRSDANGPRRARVTGPAGQVWWAVAWREAQPAETGTDSFACEGVG